MIKIKVKKLEGALLDYVVATMEGVVFPTIVDDVCCKSLDFCGNYEYYDYSNNWYLTGDIIDRERISLSFINEGIWWASKKGVVAVGKTALEAALRCHIMCTIGRTVQLPDVLFNTPQERNV